ncbi:fucose 4-O-acetylase-like acetyltransferase [Elusimicrobium posterum]|uniref:acyltransferase family protein n=1 Tax=Elusimicrobium posterum TaxID=3116653 RepID=UPI003C70D7F7
MDKKYWNWVDFTKALAIALVVCGHCFEDGAIRNTIYLFHIPLFFIISGYLSDYSSPKTGSWPSVKYMLYAVLIYNIFFIALTLAKNIAFGQSITMLLVLRYIYGIVSPYYVDSYALPVLAQFWFIFVLVFMKCFYKYLSKLKNNYIWAFLVFCIAVSYFQKETNVFWFFISRTLLAFPFFILGNMLRKTNIIDKVISWKIHSKLIIFALLVILFLSLGRLNGIQRTDMFHFSTGNSILLYYLCALAGSCSSILLALLIGNKKNKIIKTYALGTFFILATHMHLMRVLRIFIESPFIVFLLIMLLSYYPILVLQKHCPLLLGKAPAKKL